MYYLCECAGETRNTHTGDGKMAMTRTGSQSASGADWDAIKSAHESRGARWNANRCLFEYPGGTTASGWHMPAEGDRPVLTAEEIKAAWDQFESPTGVAE